MILETSNFVREHFITFRYRLHIFLKNFIPTKIHSHLELSADDRTSNCINYPTESYKSYAQCDQEYIRKDLPKGLIPFWSLPMEDITLASNKFSWNGSKEEFQCLLNKFGKFKD